MDNSSDCDSDVCRIIPGRSPMNSYTKEICLMPWSRLYWVDNLRHNPRTLILLYEMYRENNELGQKLLKSRSKNKKTLQNKYLTTQYYLDHLADCCGLHVNE